MTRSREARPSTDWCPVFDMNDTPSDGCYPARVARSPTSFGASAFRIPEPFNDPEWIFELKLDGFRALAYMEQGQCPLICTRRRGLARRNRCLQGDG